MAENSCSSTSSDSDIAIKIHFMTQIIVINVHVTLMNQSIQRKKCGV